MSGKKSPTGRQNEAPSSMSFKNLIESKSKKSKSRIILALDPDFRENLSNLADDATKIINDTSDYICGIKINFHLIAPLALQELRSINDIAMNYRLPSIADIKLNDIDNTNKVATEYLWKAGFSAVIANPLAGYEGGLDIVLKRAKELDKGVILLAYMSQKGADEGYGLVLRDNRTLFDLFLDRAQDWNADGVIVGSTRPEKISSARKRLGNETKIFSPGSGAQGGDLVRSLEAGADYLIVGRSIVESKNPREQAKLLFRSLLPWTETH